MDKLSRSLCDAQTRHDSASSALAREYADARDRWERERREEAARREEQRAEHARQLAAVVRGDEEQLAAVLAELEQSQQAFETARRCQNRAWPVSPGNWLRRRSKARTGWPPFVSNSSASDSPPRSG